MQKTTKTTNKKQTKNNTTTYLPNTHAHARTHAHASSFTRTHKINLNSDRHSFIYMNIQYIYNTQLVKKDKTLYTHKYRIYKQFIGRQHTSPFSKAKSERCQSLFYT